MRVLAIVEGFVVCLLLSCVHSSSQMHNAHVISAVLHIQIVRQIRIVSMAAVDYCGHQARVDNETSLTRLHLGN